MINIFLIFGDSYSAHKSYIPNDHDFYYCDEGGDWGEPVTKMYADQMWWGHLIKNTDAKLIRNDSWSGAAIGYTGYSGDCSETSSFICRYHKLAETGFFNENHIDTILIFGGTNDSWCQAPIGEEKYSDWEKEDLFSALPAICYFIDVLKKDHPDKRIIFLINCDSIKTEIIECIKNASKRIGIEFVELKNIDKLTKHPTVTGMEQIYCQLMAYLKSQN
ncbi:MAG: hypothetical protein IJN17_08820 [Clostridia bacterium]|nr:hypothetical protein [Clostridia bacterium]